MGTADSAVDMILRKKNSEAWDRARNVDSARMKFEVGFLRGMIRDLAENVPEARAYLISAYTS